MPANGVGIIGGSKAYGILVVGIGDEGQCLNHHPRWVIGVFYRKFLMSSVFCGEQL